MAQDPRRFLVKNCDKAVQDAIAKSTSRKSFFGSQGPIGKIGDLEVLNTTRLGGKIGEGLRTLASTSDLIRTGQKNPSTLTDNIVQGGNEVLGQVGIDPKSLEQASRLNPSVANRALGQARSIHQKVKQGQFSYTEIPQYLADFKNLDDLVSNIYTSPVENTKLYEQCGASPYAIDLIAFAPKFKFMFVVQFEYADPYKDMSELDHAFVVKTSTRPTINYEYDDVNLYNFHTKTPRMVSYEPMTMTFLDDNLNHANKFYNTYLRAMSPIANMQFDQKYEDSSVYDETGMNFEGLEQAYTGLKNGGVTSHNYSASLGPLIGDETKNVLKRITLFHVYSYGRLMNVYRFYNPKITSMDLDDLDMAEGATGNELSMTFAYDAVNILNDYEINPAAIRGETPAYDLEALSGRNRALYPIKWYSGPNGVEVTPDVGPTAQNEDVQGAQQGGTNGGGLMP